MRPKEPQPPLASTYRCASCRRVENYLAKVGSARLDGSDFRMRWQVVCSSCGDGASVCKTKEMALEAWQLASHEKDSDNGEATGSRQTIVNPVVPEEEDEPAEQYLGGPRPAALSGEV